VTEQEYIHTYIPWGTQFVPQKVRGTSRVNGVLSVGLTESHDTYHGMSHGISHRVNRPLGRVTAKNAAKYMISKRKTPLLIAVEEE
jgi:hypothetical protein